MKAAPAHPATPWARGVGPALLLFALTLLLFARSCGNGFVNYDDPDYVTANPRVQAGLSLEGIGCHELHRRLRRVMLGGRTRNTRDGCARTLGERTDQRFELLPANDAGSQNTRRRLKQREDGRFDTNLAVTAFEDRHTRRKLLTYVLGSRGRDTSVTVCRGCCDAAAKSTQQSLRHRMTRYANGDALLSARQHG